MNCRDACDCPGHQTAIWTLSCLGLVLVLLPSPLLAGVDDILEAIRQSEFRFARVKTEIPMFPVGWMQSHFYPETEFRDEDGLRPSAEVTEQSLNLGAVVPVHVDRRDMFLLGGDIARDDISVRMGPYQDQRVVRLTPVAAWLHQYDETENLAIFLAPIFSKELTADQPWARNGFAGVIGLHWYSDSLQWLYGGVYEYNFGEHFLYPYFGLHWLPSSRMALSLVIPWPTLSYVPAERWLLQLGLAPGGSSWASRRDGFESTQSFGTWNLSAGAGYRLHGSWWLYAAIGRTGFRGFTHSLSGDVSRFETQSSPVYTLALQFRP